MLHIKGGFFTYKYLGPGSGTNLKYRDYPDSLYDLQSFFWSAKQPD